MPENTLDIVLGNTYTVGTAHQRIALLKEFFEFSFYGSEPGTPTLERFNAFVRERNVEPTHAEAVAAWGAKLFGTVTAGTLYAGLNALLESLKHVPVLTLYTPVKFPPEQMSALGSRIRGLAGQMLLIDDHTDPYLFVGCGFVWNGMYHNYGLPFFFERKREELSTLITRYGSN